MIDPPAADPLAACGPVEDYAGVRYADPGQELRAPHPSEGRNRGWILVGTDGPDHIIGGNKNDCLVGLGGDDVLEGLQGRDTLLGGSGDDTLRGGNGRDLLFGGDGADLVEGENGPDTMDGGGHPGDICRSNGSPPDATPVGCQVEHTKPGKGKGKGKGNNSSTAGLTTSGQAAPEASDAPEAELVEQEGAPVDVPADTEVAEGGAEGPAEQAEDADSAEIG